MPIARWTDDTTGSQWDSLDFNAGDTIPNNVRLFAFPIGTNNAGKVRTPVDTSMHIACMLPAPESFEIQRFVFSFSKKVLAEDLYLFCEEYLFSFWLGQKRYISTSLISLPMRNLKCRAPIHICEYCHAVFVNRWDCPGCGAKEFHLAGISEDYEGNNGLCCFVLDLLQPLSILSQQHFKADFESSRNIILRNLASGGNGLRMWVHFEGIHSRGVQ